MPRKELSEIIGFDSNCYNQIMSLNEINTLSDDELLSNENIDKIKNSYVELMKPIYMLILMSVIIGIIIIYIITLLIIEDNTRNISLMKILGYRNTELNKLVININNIFVVLGLVISLPIIKLSNKFLFNKLTESLSIYLPNDISISSVIICFTVTVFTYLISKYINSKNILKIKLSYILKERNE